MKKILAGCAMVLAAISMSSCFTPTGDNSQEQRAYAKDLASSTLTELYKKDPKAQKRVENSSGYVVYNTYAIDYFFITTENGWGIAVDNKNGQQTVLKDVSVGIGPGLGIAEMRTILVFDNPIDFSTFVNGGWGFNAKADAVARFTPDGTWDIAGESDFINGARVYKIGERGLIAEAAIDLSKSWKNASLLE